ncbi:electron transport complex subunit RsxG [Zoogloea sp.]|uniref:electron transport complex subunit RsxG n=1 Tax=Zoogloea sp. TaxID=49181 RepID=UPI0035B3AF1B
MSEPTLAGLSSRTAAIMTVFTLAFTAVMAATYELTHEAIEQSANDEKMKLITEVLPPDTYDNPLLDDFAALGPTRELGLERGGKIYRARKAGAPSALLVEATAPDGYSGNIDLIVAIRADGDVLGVRVVSHRETPGLGDYIDARKDKNKASPWIGQFAGLNPAQLPLDRWKVRKDGGEISAHTGATISARAVTNAVARAARFVGAHHDRLFAAERGDIL